jgi:peptide/nickel transport system substrate-binding protein
LLQSDLAKLGIDLELFPLEQAAQTARETSGDWNLRLHTQGWANGDPDNLMARFLSSKGDYNLDKKGGYSNAEVDALVAAGQAERDSRKRFAIYERLQEIAVRDVPMTPLYHEYGVYAYRDTITGLRIRVSYQPTLDEIRLVK